MDSLDEESVFEMSDASEDFAPAPKAKAKAAPKAAAKPAATGRGRPKKMTQTTLKTTKAPKRPKPDSDEDDDRASAHDDSLLSNTPPSAKKQKKAPAPKKSSSHPLTEVENESMSMDGPSEPKPKPQKASATDRYQKLTQLEHIIKRPDTYIGSMERTEAQMWVFNSETNHMEFRKVSFVPGLYKIFDEILVNAADNKQNDPSMNAIKVTVDRESGEISVENNGRGIPVEMHAKEKIYIPEMIFGHLLTSSNYDDEEAKVTGGRNGYGAKLCNIFSTEFTLETQDSKNGKRYKQTWTNNMGTMGKAKITSNKTADFTRVTFTPDYKKFKMPGIDDDFEALLKRRVYDMAGTVKGVKVSLNGTLIKLDFKKYIEMHIKAINKERGLDENVPLSKDTIIMEDPKGHPRWEVGFAVSDGSFQQVSFVNSIATTSGGTHVNYIADQICTKLLEVVKKRNSKGATLKANQIRNHIFLFVNCLITNPAFTSQTKEQLTTKASQFGSKCPLSDKFLKDVSKTDAVENILHFAERKADQALAKSDGNRRSRINNAKLTDANLAGTKRGHECTLILTEGDSASGLAIAGRAILDPDRIGVFPLRGKMLNVRDASIDQITKNQEIQNIKQFLGLKHKAVYTDTKSLRYGHLMIMADQDHDGSHIKGLLINFLQVQFPSLLKIPDFFREFITPIVKVWKGNNPKKMEGARAFFTMPQYEEWKTKHGHEGKWSHKYYKGLGTSSNEDAQVYFTNLDEHLKEFDPMKPEEEEMLELAFSKKKADARKAWLGNFVPGTYLDHTTKKISYNDFVNKELILFSMADNLRSIPSVIDGLKPGQRKVLYACFKRNITKDMKVVELAGYVSGETAYQHGETSLQQTIVGLAQNFVGSNNVNCLEPSGNFGSRLAGGSDSASPRYIYTRLSPFARRIFSQLDEPLLEYNLDDDRKIEPKVYCPVVPMVLVNGADGIGTGWSTNIPNYHPKDIVDNLKRRMGRLGDSTEELPFEPMMPWFRGWKGTPEEAGQDRYKFNGIVFQAGDNEVEITELPIRMWTNDFKAKLEDIIKAEKAPSFIKDYKEFNDHKNVHFIIQMDEKHMKSAVEEGLAERFKLNKQIATSNLVAFDTNGRIRKYEKVEDMLEEYYLCRIKMYAVRKEHQLNVLDREYRKFTNQARFVGEIIENKLTVSKKKKEVLVAELRKRDYEPFPKVADAKKAGELDDTVENDEDPEGEEGGARDYDYLLGMPIWSLTQERVDKLRQQMLNKKKEFDDLKRLSEKDLWCIDLDAFLEEWEIQLAEDQAVAKKIRNMGRRASRKIGAGKTSTKAKKGDDDYAPAASKAVKPSVKKAVVKVQPKPGAAAAFRDMFKPKASPKTKGVATDGAAEPEGISDDDFAEIDAVAPAVAPAATKENGRTKRAAAAKPKKWVVSDDEEDSASDDDKLLGDIGDMVKGIGESKADDTSKDKGRVSLFGMSRPGSSSGDRPGSSRGLKPKTKPSKVFNLSDDDETNYEMLAKGSSPQKAAPADTDMLDSLLKSDNSDDDLPVVPKKAPAAKAKAAPKPKKAPAPKKVAAAAKQLSPAAKAYAAKQNKARGKAQVISDDEDDDVDPGSPTPQKSKAKSKAPVFSDDEDSDMEMPAPKPTKAKSKAKAVSEDEDDDLPATKPKKGKSKAKAISEDDDDDIEMLDADSSPPKPAARTGRGRPARAAAPKKPIIIESDDDDSMDESAMVDDDEEEEDFEDDDD